MRRLCLSLLCLALFMPCQAEVLLKDLDGQDIAFSSLKGKWVFINYWASWCHPCVDEIAELNRFYDANKDKHAMVFAVNYDAPPLYKQQRLVRKFSIHYPSVQLRSLAGLPIGNGVTVVPITFVFNPQGELHTTLYGGQTLASLTEVMSEHIG